MSKVSPNIKPTCRPDLFISNFFIRSDARITAFLIKFIVPLILGLCLRGAINLHAYSGQGKGPLFGDYEAQRHWMEITVNLPIQEWYINSSNNNLDYWGLDYPPLTAYHSYVLGSVSKLINSSWTDLHFSKGLESPEHKLFMRYSVIISEMLIFLPSVWIFAYVVAKKFLFQSNLNPVNIAVLFCTFPGLILIDHGHFQYNCVSLGLFILSISCFCGNKNICGTFVFCLALCYKQMELYHSLPLFFYLLGDSYRHKLSIAVLKCFFLAATVCLTLALIFSPFAHSLQLLKQVGLRLFPIGRGLFEDKVANFWCVSSVIIKWKHILPQSWIFGCCSCLTLITSLPACLYLAKRPTKSRLLYAEVLVSLSFFLFSYQVHEKSILLCAIPVLLLLPLSPLVSFYFCMISSLSLWPLLLKDRLCLPCVVLSILFYVLGSACLSSYYKSNKSKLTFCLRWLMRFSFAGYALLFFVELTFSPPVAYPFIFSLAVNCFSFVHFVFFFIYWYWEYFNADLV